VSHVVDVQPRELRLLAYRIFPHRPQWRRPSVAILAAIILVYAVFAYFYVKMARKVDARLARGAFSGTIEIFSAPRYTVDQNGNVAERPPQLITSLSGYDKRRLVHFSDIPPKLVHAVISAEDKHFFSHTGFDLLRIAKAAWVDVKDGRKEQGASTLSMQLARGLWLDSDKRWKRKAEEILITIHLEHKLTKEQIFEDYANQVYLGRRGPFSIDGFAEASRSFFGKDISQLSNAEAALLAGLVQRPSYYNPYRYPDRARERRDLVLGLMHDNGYLKDAEYRVALDTPVKLAQSASDGMGDQYFVDILNRELESKIATRGRQVHTVYTTLDPELQKAAEEAVASGMEQVDRILHRRKGAPIPKGQPQVALVALDPHTGEIKALVGGRNYASSQLNHALAMRQPGSVFKPVVYAAALESAIRGGEQIFTPATILQDDPTTFSYDGRTYQPANFGHEFMGAVTLREALMHSLNVATVSLAQQVGYNTVADMARRLGLNDGIKPTPAMALGAYETTPLEIAGAYTTFANHGVRITPTTVASIRGANGTIFYQYQPDPRDVLDPRVNYLMVSLMQDVLRAGTGAGVRARGFTLPAAGKTGTSRDGWFAGFTSQLECVVWVGFDDNRDLNLEGAKSALPIWTEFMKRAAQLRPYHDAVAFKAPSGIVSAEICPQSGQLAGQFCPDKRIEVFIQGSAPAIQCQIHTVQANEADRATTVNDTSSAPAAAAQTMLQLVPTTTPPIAPDLSGRHPARIDNH
jgi:penicillin-binding protein 1B